MEKRTMVMDHAMTSSTIVPSVAMTEETGVSMIDISDILSLRTLLDIGDIMRKAVLQETSRT